MAYGARQLRECPAVLSAAEAEDVVIGSGADEL